MLNVEETKLHRFIKDKFISYNSIENLCCITSGK